MNYDQVTYRSANYNEADVCRCYIAITISGFLKHFEVNAAGYTIQEGFVAIEDISASDREKAHALIGKMFNQVLIWEKPQ